jgi:hypothetical protein
MSYAVEFTCFHFKILYNFFMQDGAVACLFTGARDGFLRNDFSDVNYICMWMFMNAFENDKRGAPDGELRYMP